MRHHLYIFAILLFSFPLFAHAVLVNINTADATLLDTLPGIGPSKAGAIVEYRTQYGLFMRIEDIQNVSGIGTSTYDGLKPFITIGDTLSNTSDAIVASSTPENSSSGGAAYTPPPSALFVDILGNQKALSEVPLRLTARVTTKSGVVDTSAQVLWSFGDGSKGEGSVVEKMYQYVGTYLIVATAIDGVTKARDEFIVTVTPASVHMLPIASEGMTIVNDADERLDLSGWWLSSGGASFRIPEGTMLLPKSSVLFPFAITNLPMTFDAKLAYPNGSIATSIALRAATPPVAVVQPAEASVSYIQVQKVEPIISPKTDAPSHEEAVVAPAPVLNKETGAGAPLPLAQTAASANAPTSGILRSPWTYGLFGVMLVAAGAFILL